jgi:hypothetical protein
MNIKIWEPKHLEVSVKEKNLMKALPVDVFYNLLIAFLENEIDLHQFYSLNFFFWLLTAYA